MKPIDAYNPWHWIAFLAVLWWSLAGGLLMFTRGYFGPLFVQGDHGRFLAFWTTAAANEWLASAIVLLALSRSATSINDIGFEWPSRRATISFAILTAALVMAILMRPERNAGGTFPGMPPNAAARAMLPWTRSDRLFMVVLMSSTAALCEEMVYRGFATAFLRSMLGLWPAVILQARCSPICMAGLPGTPRISVSVSRRGTVRDTRVLARKPSRRYGMALYHRRGILRTGLRTSHLLEELGD